MTFRLAPRLFRSLAGDRDGIAVIEFAIAMPLLLLFGLGLVELADYVLVREQVSQLALQVSDNASRIGTANSIQYVVDEGQINDLFIGAGLQSGRLNVQANGRIVLSSLEVDPTSPNGQYIHWQRCYGSLAYASAYGAQGTGKGTTTLAGMGPPGSLVTATTSAPVMFVEVRYHYTPIIPSPLLPPSYITEIAAMQVRDNRDTSGAGINPVVGVTASTC